MKESAGWMEGPPPKQHRQKSSAIPLNP
jgi:hypothetical protein